MCLNVSHHSSRMKVRVVSIDGRGTIKNPKSEIRVRLISLKNVLNDEIMESIIKHQ